MHITRQENGMFKVELKGFDFPFFVEEYSQALTLVLSLKGIK
jgi:hypothetical protein